MSLKEILRFTVIAAVFAVPFICLYVADSMFFPFITGKNFTFRILVEIMLGAWAILMFIDASYRPKFSYVLAAAGTFLGIIALADFLGANPFRSFWSNYERMEGLVAHAHLFLYFLIAGTVLARENIWLWFFRTTLGVSVWAMIISFSQLAGKAEIHQSATRLDATFGNSTYLAIFTLFHIFIAAFLWFREKQTNLALRIIYPIIAFGNLIVLYYTQTRGTMIGLILGGGLTFLLIALFDKEHPKLKKYALGGIVGVILLVAGFISMRNAAFIQSSPVLSRFAEISLTDMTTSSRFLIWHMSFEGFKERPILGWGQDNFIYVFAKYYDPAMHDQEPWFDRSHDVFFDWLIAGGALGLLAYLSMFGMMIYYFWFGKKKPFTVVEKSILTGMLAGYFVHNIFVFDNITSYILFFSVLAYVHFMYHEEPAPPEIPVKGKKKKEDEITAQDAFVAGIIIIAATAAMVYFINIRNINANLALIDALKNPISRDTKGGYTIGLQSVIENPDGTFKRFFGLSEAREQLGQLAFSAQDQRVDAKLRSDIFTLAQRHFNDEIERDPNNLRYQSFVASFYARFGQYNEAEQYYKKSVELSPRRQLIYLDRGSMYLQTGRLQDALSDFKTAYELAPEYTVAQQQYGIVLIYAKQFDEAERVMQPLRQFTPYYDQRVVNAWGNAGQYPKVIELVNEKIGKGWATGRDYLSLAGAYWELGDKVKAKAAVEQAVTTDPSLKDQADKIIEQISVGK